MWCLSYVHFVGILLVFSYQLLVYNNIRDSCSFSNVFFLNFDCTQTGTVHIDRINHFKGDKSY